MRGDDGAAVLRQACHDVADLGVERFDLGDVGLAVGIECAGVVGVGLGQGRRDVVDIGDGVVEALPGMRVEGAVIVVMPASACMS